VNSILLLLCCSSFQFSGVDTVKVDAIEVNHLHDGRGGFFFTQVIFWDVLKNGERVCQGWRNIDKCVISGDTVFLDGRKVRFSSRDKSWTDDDPEVAARRFWPVWRRSVK
jgi:hypothetical protein